MAEFVTITEDKFKNKISYQNTNHLQLEVPLFGRGSYLNYRRVVVMPECDLLVIDIEVKNLGWVYLSKGQLVMLIDGENVTIDAKENWDVVEKIGGTPTGCVIESCHYEIDKDILKRICDSKSFAMKIYADSSSYEVSTTNAIVVYSRLFYNAVYDNNAYTDTVTNALESFTGLAAGRRCFKGINIDGSGAGCMVALLFYLSLAGGAIGGLCSMI